MNVISTIALQEITNGLRNKWVAGSIVVMALLSLSLTLLGSAPTGAVGASRLSVVIVSLASLSIFLIPLIALLLAHDAIVGESERGTLILLLAYPVARWQLLAGKFLGHLAVVAVAAIIGYGAAAIAVAGAGASAPLEELPALARLVATAVLLGAVFLALGYLVSAVVRERATAVGLSVGLWLIFVIVFDLALLGVLVALEGALPEGVLTALLLLNPADVFRLLNLTGSDTVALAAGMTAAGAKAGLSQATLLLALLAWTAAGLGLGWVALERKEL